MCIDPKQLVHSARLGIVRPIAKLLELTKLKTPPKSLEPRVQNGKAWIGRKQFRLGSHAFEKVVGRGANAVVFKAESRTLKRVEAVKVYLPREGDARDKLTQGIFEAQKQAAAAFNSEEFHVVQVYSAAVLRGRFYATMEYVEGPNMKEWAKTATLRQKWFMARHYMSAMHNTTTPQLFHGDPHMGNMIVGLRHISICDYGTSHFDGRSYGWERHWQKIDETMRVLLKDFGELKQWRGEFHHTSAEMMFAAYQDVLRALTFELFRRTDGTSEEFSAAEKGYWQLR